ncbi:MAG: metallophosphoesterase [Ignavibacterium sp.]|nr:metallophosphoesterase [Ignavibacterium sp.]
MTRKLVVSDIHGYYDALVTCLKKAKYNPDKDELICLGDMINRGPKSYEVVSFMKKYASVVILGNHEIGFPLWFYQKTDPELFYKMGGIKTIDSYYRHKNPDKKLANHIEWLMTLSNMHEDDEYIYIHASLDYKKPLYAQTPESLLWGQNRDFFKTKNPLNKTIVHGHVPVEHIYRWNGLKPNYRQAVFHDNKISIDGGSIGGKYIFVYDLTNKITYAERVNNTK